MDIIAAYREAGTYRGAAEIAGTTHKTVRRVIARHEAGGAAPARAPRGRNYDGVAALVAERVKKTLGRISAKRLLPAARAAGYAGSDRNFRRLVAEQKAVWRREHHRGRRPAVWSPGEHLVIDWGAEGGLHVFCAVLAWCRFRFVRFAADERAATTLALLAECFEVLGGVPGKVLADRMGCLKGAVVANVVVPTAEYVRFAGALRVPAGFLRGRGPGIEGDRGAPGRLCQERPDGAAGPVRGPGGGERRGRGLVRRGQRRGPQRDLRGPGRAAGHRAGAAGPAAVAAGQHRAAVIRKVDRLSCVRFGSARYSVPVRLIGESVGLRTDDGRLLVIMTAAGQVVAEHVLVAPGEASVRDEHYGGPRPAPRRAVRPKTAAEKAFCALGPVAEAFITGAAAAGQHPAGAGAGRAEHAARRPRRARRSLAALDRAVAFGRWRAADVRSILAAGPGTADPRPAGDALVLELPVVPVRPLSDYAIGGLS